jgi:hypothetical protein
MPEGEVGFWKAGYVEWQREMVPNSILELAPLDFVERLHSVVDEVAVDEVNFMTAPSHAVRELVNRHRPANGAIGADNDKSDDHVSEPTRPNRT